MAKNTYRDSPFGIAKNIHVNKPDDKFNKENPPFHLEVTYSGADAISERELIDAKAQEAFDAFMTDGDGSKLTPAERKKWSVYKPYAVVEDDEGNETGDIAVDYKQNSIIRTRDGVKNVQIGLYDANGDEMTDLVRFGSTLRVRHSFRAITLKTNKQVGVRLDFSMVQVSKMAEGTGGGFGKVDGGYTKRAQKDNPGDAPFDGADDKGAASEESDY